MNYLKIVWQALIALILLTVLTGVVYPLVVFGFAQIAFPFQSNGSLVYSQNGAVIGSDLIGRRYEHAGYLAGRRSASEYNAMPGSASNLGPTSEALKARLQEGAGMPTLLVFSSASGLDPHISKEAARFQFDRILQERDWAPERRSDLEAALDACGTERSLYMREKVNVFCFNRRLDGF